MRTVSFGDFEGYWTPITASRDPKANKPLALMLTDLPVVAFRDAAGRAKALVDRCPHRSVKLSIGEKGLEVQWHVPDRFSALSP